MRKAVILLLALGSIQAQANDSKDVSGFYLGGGIGNTTYSDDDPFTHIDGDGTVHEHGVLVTVECGASVEDAVDLLVRETTVIEGISHIHIPGDNSNIISF